MVCKPLVTTLCSCYDYQVLVEKLWLNLFTFSSPAFKLQVVIIFVFMEQEANIRFCFKLGDKGNYVWK